MSTDTQTPPPTEPKVDDTTAQVNDEDLANFDEVPGDTPAAATDGVPPAAAVDPAVDPAAAAGAGADPADPAAAVVDPDLLRAVAEGEGDGPMIPKARFDERTGELKDELRDVRATVDRMAAERKAALAPLGEPRDFDKERAELKARYNDEDGEMDQDTYLDARDKLTLEEAEYRARASALLAQREAEKNAALASWNGKRDAWATKHADALSVGAIKESVNRFLEANDDDSLTDEQLLEKAEEHMNAEVANLRRLLGGEAPAPKDPATTGGAAADPATTAANPHQQRNANDAKAQARASAAPDPAAAGAGDRGRETFPGVLDLKDKDFAKLPKDVRESKDLANF